MGTTKNLLAIVGGTVLLGVTIGSCTVIDHFWSGSRQTREIGTPDYILENYRWFKSQSTAIEQVNAQITSTRQEITEYKKGFEGTPLVSWPFDAREELARKESILRGYISQYNKVSGDYNARVSDATRQWTKGSEPEEVKPFLRQYEQFK